MPAECVVSKHTTCLEGLYQVIVARQTPLLSSEDLNQDYN